MLGGDLEKDDPVKTVPPTPYNPLDDNPELRLKVGIMLGHIRREKRVSQEKAAQVNKVSRPHLSNIEQGRARTNWKSLERMASYYTIGIQELIDRAERELPPLPTATTKTGLLTRTEERWVAPVTAPPIAPNASQILNNDEAFVINMWRVLGPNGRNAIRKQLMRLVQTVANELEKP